MEHKLSCTLSAGLLIGALSLGVGSIAKAGDIATGEAKYKQLCITCHGPSGKGDGPAAAGLNPKPKDLSITTRTAAEMKNIIAKGGTAGGLSPMMPPWEASLTPEEIDGVILYIRSLKK